MSTAALPRPVTTSGERWFLLALVALFVALSIQYTQKVLKDKGAVTRWREQLLQWDEGENIWEKYQYPNPPIMALILRPLADLSPLTGALTWFYFKAALALLCYHWLFGLVQRPDRPFPPWAKGLTVLLSIRPIMGDLSHGNVNIFILFLVVGALVS